MNKMTEWNSEKLRASQKYIILAPKTQNSRPAEEYSMGGNPNMQGWTNL